MLLGTVASIDRANSIAYVVPRGESARIPMIYRAKRGRLPFWPLATVEYEQLGLGSYRIVGAIGDRRVIVHDDFLTAAGDTKWTFGHQSDVGAGAASITQAGGALDVSGAAEVNSGTPSAATTSWAIFYKDAASVSAPASGTAMWLSASLQVLTSSIFALGFIQNPTTVVSVPGDQAWFFGDSPASGYYHVVAQSGASQVAPLVIPSSRYGQNLWGTFEVLWTPNMVACWLLGDGPYWVGTDVPTSALTPVVVASNGSIGGGAAPADTFAVDYMHLETVSLLNTGAAVGVPAAA